MCFLGHITCNRPQKTSTNFTKISSISQPDGFAFSQEEGGVITQSEVIRCYDSNKPKPEGN